MKRINFTYIPVVSIDQLKELCLEGKRDFFCLLGGGLRSSKSIDFIEDERSFQVVNEVDGYEFKITEDEIKNPHHTSYLRQVIERGILYLYNF